MRRTRRHRWIGGGELMILMPVEVAWYTKPVGVIMTPPLVEPGIGSVVLITSPLGPRIVTRVTTVPDRARSSGDHRPPEQQARKLLRRGGAAGRIDDTDPCGPV